MRNYWAGVEESKLESGKGTREQGILGEFSCMANSRVAIVTEMI